MKQYNKQRSYKTTQEVINEIRTAGEYIINQNKFSSNNNSIYAITLKNTGCKHEKDLNHVITNRLFNSIKKVCKNTLNHTNYLFVIEYPEVVSRGNYLPTNCEVHSHVIVNTSLSLLDLEKFITQAFPKTIDYVIKDMTLRNDKQSKIDYLVKQGKENYYLSDSSFNYKILIE